MTQVDELTKIYLYQINCHWQYYDACCVLRDCMVHQAKLSHANGELNATFFIAYIRTDKRTQKRPPRIKSAPSQE
jgi:hypothetical protein